VVQQIGRYEIVRELGQGAMGVVYAAVDPLIGRTVAIKTIRLEMLDAAENHAELTRRLQREAQSAGILSHPGIITIHDIGNHGALAYIVMEYIDGANLETLLTSGTPQRSGTLLSILKQTAVALDYAHGKGIVHRDIKPSNIMIGVDGTIKIADFGVAKLTTSASMTQAGLVLGTPSYMSPEQAQGHDIDGRSDQFSLAVIAYRVLTGELPFKGATLTTLLTRILLEEPHYESYGLHPCFQEVFRQALAKDPASRYSDCVAFVQDLETAHAHSKAELAALVQPAAEREASAAAPAAWFQYADATTEKGGTADAAPDNEGSFVETAPQPTAQYDLPGERPVPDETPVSTSSPQAAVVDGGLHEKGGRFGRFVWIAVVVILLLALAGIYTVTKDRETGFPADISVKMPEDATAEAEKMTTTDAPVVSVGNDLIGSEKLPPPDVDYAKTAPPISTSSAGKTASMPRIDAAPKSEQETPPAVSGVIVWKGNLGRNAILVITADKASIGTVSGELPGRPVSIKVEPGELVVRNPPGEANKWKQIMLHSGNSRYSTIAIHWSELP
jgi:tRNA A-37 threonylcarbamoyl transferase component Bud32